MAQLHRGKHDLSSKSRKNIAAGIFFSILVVGGLYFLFTRKITVNHWIYLAPMMTSVVLAGYYFRRAVIFRFGARGENIGLAQALKLPENYHVFSNVRICYQDFCQEADLIIVGIKGVYVVEVKNHNGRIVGKGEDATWMQHKIGRGGGKYSKEMPNPVKQVRGQVYKLSKLFKEYGINVWVEGIVLFTNDSVNVHVQNASVPVLYPASRLNHHILTHHNKQYLNRTLIKKTVEILSTLQE
jgi:hypothetical protein